MFSSSSNCFSLDLCTEWVPSLSVSIAHPCIDQKLIESQTRTAHRPTQKSLREKEKRKIFS